jgi:hypothetical protein
MDLGKGFDVEAAKKDQGAGSSRWGGTTVHVRVPFSSEKFSERAVG